MYVEPVTVMVHCQFAPLAVLDLENEGFRPPLIVADIAFSLPVVDEKITLYDALSAPELTPVPETVLAVMVANAL